MATSAQTSALSTARPSRAGLAQVVVGHVPETEPDRKHETGPPRDDHAPKNPVGHAVDEPDAGGVAVVAHRVATADAPEERDRPDGHDEPALAARVPQ